MLLFRDWCGPLVSALVKTRYIAYSEGWALYAENPLISMETGKITPTVVVSFRIKMQLNVVFYGRDVKLTKPEKLSCFVV